MRACTYTRADTLGASAFTWSACCTSRPRRAPLIYGDRINYKEQIEKSVNRLWRTVSAIILLCLASLPRVAHDRLSLAEARRGRNFRPSSRISIFEKSYFSPLVSGIALSLFFFLSFLFGCLEIIEQSNAIKACILCERITLTGGRYAVVYGNYIRSLFSFPFAFPPKTKIKCIINVRIDIS